MCFFLRSSVSVSFCFFTDVCFSAYNRYSCAMQVVIAWTGPHNIRPKMGNVNKHQASRLVILSQWKKTNSACKMPERKWSVLDFSSPSLAWQHKTSVVWRPPIRAISGHQLTNVNTANSRREALLSDYLRMPCRSWKNCKWLRFNLSSVVSLCQIIAQILTLCRFVQVFLVGVALCHDI